MPQLKVKRLEELLQGRAGILNVIRDINLPVRITGEPPLLQSALESTTIVSILQWHEEQMAKVVKKIGDSDLSDNPHRKGRERKRGKQKMR